MLNAIVITAAIGIIQSLLFSILVFLKKNKQTSDWMMIAWLLIFPLHLLLIIRVLFFDGEHAILTSILAKTLILVQGPFLLLYTYSFFSKRLDWQHMLHWLPFIGFIIFGYQSIVSTGMIAEPVLFIAKTLSLIGYPIYLKLWLNKRMSLMKDSTAANYVVEYRWIRTLILLFIIYAATGVLHVLLEIVFNVQFSILLDLFLFVFMINLIGFFGLKFNTIYQVSHVRTPQQNKYKNSPIDNSNLKELQDQIIKCLDASSDYRDPSYSLSQLSDQTGIPKHHLSQVINQVMGSSFYDLINARRVEYAKMRLQKGLEKHISVEGLGYESGFNSKSAFYHHFKQYTGLTPGQFISKKKS